MKRKYGWRRQLPDHRDFSYRIGNPKELPTSIDLRPTCPPVYDQGELGSCTANAIAGAIQFNQIKETIDVFTPSRLFIYYNERASEGTILSDAGAEIRDGIKSVYSLGVCREANWPYIPSQFSMTPSSALYEEAFDNRIKTYEGLPNQDIYSVKEVLANGELVVFGFSVYESFESDKVANTGIMSMPKLSESLLGGHAVAAVGYDDELSSFIIRNSWGNSWGMSGYFLMPYDYISSNYQYASDFWVIKSV